MPRFGLPATLRTTAAPDRSGFTLLETAVVLVLLGITLALVVPTLRISRTGPTDPIQTVLDAARREAVHRAESLGVAVGTDGRWVVEAADSGGVAPLMSGRLETPPAVALRVQVTPLGGCWLEGGASTGWVLDPLRCRLGAGARS